MLSVFCLPFDVTTGIFINQLKLHEGKIHGISNRNNHINFLIICFLNNLQRARCGFFQQLLSGLV